MIGKLKSLILRAIDAAGYTISRKPRWKVSAEKRILKVESRKIHYGSGGRLMSGWVNVDLYPSESLIADPVRVSANLTLEHPFADGWFLYAFSEDFFEHLEQKQQLLFLVEAYRVLAPGGVLRMSFPGLEGVLMRHFSDNRLASYGQGVYDSYDVFEHKHFASRAELELMCRHIGFSSVDFEIKYGESRHEPLKGLDSRVEQIGLNTYAEITK
ncbi:MAG TPA: methyltransferase domain-containing protein [Leptospiraceae bacterium]|jgi:predicted SAM-dependent methyltransferase|nr:methyltransferase domain-containing protein [Leptospirales bacterium]HMU84013.1 methyltransferase domain-containing protein [Leptospiraceae bacterium]HMX56275.1 methyltransferase domain-containing protein [Leptospiraceae bacterium]HMY45617.1 methyltransferase domain-containing protein [Leptospiraceae bacterium]HMZ35912.1 methyltransferase domain-containing protein [Leptospiraceae bacterium]